MNILLYITIYESFHPANRHITIFLFWFHPAKGHIKYEHLIEESSFKLMIGTGGFVKSIPLSNRRYKTRKSNIDNAKSCLMNRENHIKVCFLV